MAPPLIPIFVAAAAIGTASGVAGLGLQVSQHLDAQKQSVENRAFLALQTKLAKYQIEQFENSTKANEHQESAIRVRRMFKSPVNIPAVRPVPATLAVNQSRTMTTRYLARVGDLGTQLMPQFEMVPITRVNAPTPVPTQYVRETNIDTGQEVRRRLSLNPIGSLSAGRNTTLMRTLYGGQPAGAGSIFEDILLNSRSASIDTLNAPNLNTVLNRNFRQAPWRTRLSQTFAPVKRFFTPTFRLLGRGRKDIDPIARYKKFDDDVNLEILPTRRSKLPLARRIKHFVKRHKRALAIGGGILGSAALVGAIAGGLSNKRKTKESEMIEKNSGTLANLIKGRSGSGFHGLDSGGGGGGGSGFGGYIRHYADIVPRKRRRVKRKTPSKKQGKKSKKSKKRSTKRLSVKRRIVGKKRINKRRKSRKSKKRFAAF